MKVVIIGYGNPLRGDDGVGWYVAGRLADLCKQENVQVMAVHQLMPELAATISSVDHLILIDADCTGKPGEISRHAIRPSTNKKITTHSMTPDVLLACARELYNATPQAELFTIGGECFDHKEGLSPVVQRACDQVVGQIRGMLGCMEIDEQAHSDRPQERYGYA